MKANAPLWIVSLGQGGGDSAAVGGPGAPVITEQKGGVIWFDQGEEGAAGATLGYGCEIEPEGPTLALDVVDPADGGVISVSNTQPDTEYVVTVYGVNAAGRGKSARTDPFLMNYNAAEGSGSNYDYKEQDDWNGTGQKWAVHTYRANGTFTVRSDVEPFHVLVVAGGGNGAGQWGNNAQGFVGGSGGSGGVIYTKDSNNHVTAPQGDYPIVVGGQNVDSSAFGLVAKKGGRGNQGAGSSGGSGGGSAWADAYHGPGGGTAYQGHAGEAGAFQGGRKRGGGAGNYEASTSFTSSGRVVDIRGYDETVAAFGNTSWGSGGWGEGYNAAGKPGQTGAVVVAYQIGFSTTREIEQARAVAAARQEGFVAGEANAYTAAYEEVANEVDAMIAGAKAKRTRKKAAE